MILNAEVEIAKVSQGMKHRFKISSECTFSQSVTYCGVNRVVFDIGHISTCVSVLASNSWSLH